MRPRCTHIRTTFYVIYAIQQENALEVVDSSLSRATHVRTYQGDLQNIRNTVLYAIWSACATESVIVSNRQMCYSLLGKRWGPIVICNILVPIPCSWLAACASRNVFRNCKYAKPESSEWSAFDFRIYCVVYGVRTAATCEMPIVMATRGPPQG